MLKHVSCYYGVVGMIPQWKVTLFLFRGGKGGQLLRELH